MLSVPFYVRMEYNFLYGTQPAETIYKLQASIHEN
jgi:hypothetical protein